MTESPTPAPRPIAGPDQPPIPRREPARRQPGLFERIGGREVVDRVATDFYDRVYQDPILRPMFPDDREAGRLKQAEFLEQWLGGAPRYSEKWGHPRLRMRHFPFVIDERSAGRWLRHMTEALRACGVGEQEVQEVLVDLGPLARHMVNADQDVPREPLGDVRLS
ncbi:MAG: globin [Dehalococcoidia bacterium]|nr:globin [Dehalococcoidia bacterium]